MDTWTECKKMVEKLPQMEVVLQSIKNTHPEDIDRYETSKGVRIVVKLNRISGYEILGERIYDREGALKRDMYTAYNTQTNSCFIRNLLDLNREIESI